MRIKPTTSLIFLLSLCLFSCRSTDRKSQIKTDLGPEGNAAVVADFAAYKAKTSHCNSSGASKRAIVTGFGLFSGASFNISGVVAQSFADTNFWPKKYSSNQSPVLTAAMHAQPGRTSGSDSGAVAYQRTLEIDGTPYEICVLVLDVTWDLAAAIILYEAEKFRPQAIFMSGRGARSDTGLFEWGALNDATGIGGYDSNGGADDNNMPVQSYVLPNTENNPAATKIAMTWNNAALVGATAKFVQTIDDGYSLAAETDARLSNNYICNNVSYVLLHAQKGYPARLAGEKITLSTSLRNLKIGFFHYPLDSTNEDASVLKWSEFLVKNIQTLLPR